MCLRDLVRELREYRGVSRKSEVSDLASRLLRIPEGDLLASIGEDAAAIDYGDRVLLLAADGIMEDLISTDPYWAGYCSVLVNVNDIAAMGGMPLALVDIISCSDSDVRERIAEGLGHASEKFGVPVVGGHLHPDTTYSAIDVAVLGETDTQHLVRSSGAVAGHDILFAMDLDGQFTPRIPYSWDTSSLKDTDEVRRGLASMHAVAPMISAGKDISNPGSLGSAGMLLEASGAGGRVDVNSIPKPDNVELVQWLKAYQGCGFVVTCEPTQTESVAREFSRRGLIAAACGSVEDGNRMSVESEGDREMLFDFSTDTLGCRPPQRI
ncbi:MAG: methanogenesis marker 2 protein [Methanobacteriota archaeon]|nr:MAG: methanogenesis marker 2 protein [Euryarchaeota archaeon]